MKLKYTNLLKEVLMISAEAKCLAFSIFFPKDVEAENNYT